MSTAVGRGDYFEPVEDTIGPFGAYARRLCTLLQAPHDEKRVGAVAAALDGEASQLLRSSVSLASRRSTGCFFTNAELARALVDDIDVGAWKTIGDAACGAGDLLLAAARRLPLQRGPRSTLAAWGQVLVGRDLDEELVRTTRVRLALLASARHGWHVTLDEEHIAALLPDIRSGDGQRLKFPRPGLMLLNPPFGSTLSAGTGWSSGRVARAAIFTAAVIDALPPGSRLLAILPDVLRSGSNYAHWRDHISSLMHIDVVDARGQFDPWTDVDIFILRATASAERSSVTWTTSTKTGSSLGDVAEIRVGPVVPHRDPHYGSWAPYIEAHDLPLGGRFDASAARRRRHRARAFTPPFVAVRRTSRPGQSQPRALGVLVEGDEPVLVENHLLVCRPLDDSSVSCNEVLRVLAARATSRWLDERIRCRHLTVRALRDIPLCD